MIGRDRSTQKVGVETDWVDPEINDPEQGDLEIKIKSRFHKHRIVPPSGGRKDFEARHRTIESEEVTLPDSDRGDRCFEKTLIPRLSARS
ncbi:hypothetical protein TNCV_1039821 [Trichonephila clavipes]|nr:hypothetical protein TNCV_1039821 [Trichonephila clavipes]